MTKINALRNLTLSRDGDGEWASTIARVETALPAVGAVRLEERSSLRAAFEQCVQEGVAEWNFVRGKRHHTARFVKDAHGAVAIARVEDSRIPRMQNQQAILDALSFPACCIDETLLVLACNSSFANWIGTPLSEIVGCRSAKEFFLDDTEDEAKAFAALESRVTKRIKKAPPGSGRPFAICGVSLVPLAEPFPMLMCLLEGGTSCSYRLARHHPMSSFGSNLSMELLLDGCGKRVLDANELFATKMGYSFDQLQELDPMDLFPQLNRSQLDSRLQQVKENSGGRGDFNSLMLRNDRSVIATEVRVRHLKDFDGDYFLAQVRDVTGIIQTNTALKGATRALRLLGAMNKSIVGASSEEAILGAVCRDAAIEGGFAAVYALCFEEGSTSYAPRIYKHDPDAPSLEAALESLGFNQEEREAIFACSGESPAVRRGRSYLTRGPRGLPKLATPHYSSLVSLPLSHDSDRFGALLIATHHVEQAEEALDHLMQIADAVARSIAIQRQNAGRMRAEQQVAQRSALELAIAQFSSDLLVGEDFSSGASRGLRNLMQAVRADCTFLYEVFDDEVNLPRLDLAFCHTYDSRPNSRGLAASIPLPSLSQPTVDFASLLKCRLDAGLQEDPGPPASQLLFPMLCSERLLGFVGFIFADPSECRDQSTNAMLRIAVQLMSDVRERDTANRKLKLLATAMDSTNEGVLIAAAKGSYTDSPIVLVNEGLCRVTGFSRDELLQSTPAKLLCNTAGSVGSILLDGSKGPWSGKTNFRHKDGSLYLAEYTVYPIAGPEESIAQYACIIRDITERHQMETRLAFANKMESVGQLSAGIAHEINTPSQFISDNLRYLSDAWTQLGPMLDGLSASLSSDGDPAELRRLKRLLDNIPGAIEDACEGISRISSIVKAMKEFSHPGKQFVAANINQCVSTTLTVARNEWKYVSEVELFLSPDIPPVEMLPGDINQVLLNLIVNAAHAIEAKARESAFKGKIEIRTQRSNGGVQVSVSDNGSGMPASIRDSVFDPFFTTKEVGKGTGQGLFMAHAIIEQKHGGRIWFETESDVGTTFHFEIPLQQTRNDDDSN